MIQYSVSWRDETGELHLLQPFYNDKVEAKHFALHNYVEYEREIIPWSVDDKEPRFAYPLLESKEIIKPKKTHAKTPNGFEQLTLFD